ncbi:hypothetical protein BN2364_0828 [Alloalcanivorax xenomutans]|nr:hypothetical protein BN2364_0828 [Alloalcanivorax xenomutans]
MMWWDSAEPPVERADPCPFIKEGGKMRLESPILDAGREATPEAIEEVVRRLPESDDPLSL